MNYKDVFASLSAEKLVMTGISESSLPHAMLIACEDEGLSNAFAKHVAKAILGGCADCGNCPTCKKVDARSHPDYLFYPKEECGKIAAADVEEMIRSAYFKPIESKRKVIVIYGIELLLENVQNKLLKIIEEPPQNTYFIITARSEKNALQTIRSRSTVYNIEGLSTSVIYDLILNETGDKERARIIAENSNGSIDRAFAELNEGNTYAKLKVALKVLTVLRSSKNVFEASMLFDGYKEEEIFSLLLGIFRDMLCIKCSSYEVMLYKSEWEEIEKLAQGYSEMAIIECIELINKAISLKNFHVNKNASVDGLLLNILEVKYNCQK